MRTGPDTGSSAPTTRMGLLKLIALIAVSLLVAEAGLQVYSLFLSHPEMGFVYVPYIEHINPVKHPGTADGFPHTFGQDRGNPPIWFMGGSTMFGMNHQSNADDCEPEQPCSIPSQFNSLLADRGLQYSAWNFGQLSYNSTQERILFQEMLYKSEKPEIVVFYDGVNEFAVSGIIGYPDLYRLMQDRLESRLAWSSFYGDMRKSFLKIPYLLDFLANSEDFLGRGEPTTALEYNPFSLFADMMTVDFSFDRELAERYIYNLKLTQSICDSFGIKCIFLWQPHVCTKRHLSENERDLAAQHCSTDTMRQRQNVPRLIKDDPWIAEGVDFLDLTQVLDLVEENVYLDWCHIDPSTRAHRVIAAAILDILIERGMLPNE